MEDPFGLEQLVEKHIEGNNIGTAVGLLCDLITHHAKAKCFKKAESLRDRLMELDPMALSEIIRSAEIIEEEKEKARSQDGFEIWADLFKILTTEEGNALYYAMEEGFYAEEQPVYVQGEENANLYFVMEGQVRIQFTQGGREVVLKILRPGEILGEDNFFFDTVCTCDASSFPRARLKYLAKSVLLEWKGKFPALESKLYSYCLKSEKLNDLLARKKFDRRVDKRFSTSGKAVAQLLNAAGSPVGKPFRVDLSDISASGLSCFVRISKKETARLLLGRILKLDLLVQDGEKARPIGQKGTVVAVRSNPFEDYSLHVKFDKRIDGNILNELIS